MKFKMLGRHSSQIKRQGGLKILPIILFGIFVLYYYTSHQEIVPHTGRTQLVSSDSEIIPLALNSYRSILAQSEIVRAGKDLELVRMVARKIINVVDRPDLDWEVNVIKSEQANAFALPGGKIAVYTGILPITKNVDGLAAVIGHEIAHVTARHGQERMAHEKLVQLGTMAAGMSVSEMDPATQRAIIGALGLGSQFGFKLPYSRIHETEADEIGLIYLAKACFNPEEAPKLWQRMADSTKQSVPELLSTHPAPESRVEHLKSLLPKANKIFQENCSLL